MEKIFNDSVHGPIRLHPLCVKIIDTPEFQRLRNIKQLGTTYHVYPAASHNRFEHSLGVCYLAGRMVNALKENMTVYSATVTDNNIGDVKISNEDKLCVEIAGLCHDIGHGPFSHLWEHVLASCGIKWKHETSSAELFDHLLVANNLINDFESYGITEEKRNFIKELILGRDDDSISENRFLYQIVANKDNDIDVDKWDYFLRDGLQMNLKITFDYNRLLQFCCVVRDPENESRRVIGFRNKEADNLHDMFRVRADLHRKAYQHCVVKNIDLMYIDAFVEANRCYKFRVNKQECILSDAHKNMNVFTRLTDHVFESILNDPDPGLEEVQSLIYRILTRKLYTHVNTYLIKVPEVCNKVDVCEIKEKLNSYFDSKFYPHELRFCPIKLDYNRNIDSLKKVIVFSKRNLTNLMRIDVKKIFGPLPLEDAYTGVTFVQIHAYCRTYNLDEKILKDIDKEINNGLYSEAILNNNNNMADHGNIGLLERCNTASRGDK